MTENFSVSELVIPGTYIRVRAEGLISAGGISTGNIGIVGTARKPQDDPDPVDYTKTYTLSDYATAQAELGAYDAYADGAGKLNLVRSLEILFRNGARTVYARPLNLGDQDAAPELSDYTAAFNELIKDDVNILIAPELITSDAKTVLVAIVESAENNGKDLIAVIGSDASEKATITGQVTADDRLIMSTPGFESYDSVAGDFVTLNGRYSAAAVAGLLSTLPPQSSPTNKKLSGITKLSQRFSYSDTKDLINGGLLVMEERLGVRTVRGITTEMASNGPFKQITTRRIVDFAKAGIRQVCNPFIGRLNNERVRKAMQGAIDGFLTTMVQDEALTEYSLQVTASRDDEIAGRALVNAVLKPTFSIDFIAVTLVLE